MEKRTKKKRRTKKKMKKQKGNGPWDKKITKTRSAPVKKSETIKQKKEKKLEKSLFGNILSPEEVEMDFLTQIAKEHNPEATTNIGEIGKYKIQKRKDEEEKKKEKFKKMYEEILGPFESIEDRDIHLRNMTPIDMTDLPFNQDEFEGLSCQEKGRRCQLNQTMRETCNDQKINRKYLLPCKISYDINLAVNRIFNIFGNLEQVKARFPNILNMDVRKYIHSYISFSDSEIIGHQIYVYFNPQTHVWGWPPPPLPDIADDLLEEGSGRIWNHMISEEIFMQYISTLNSEEFFNHINRQNPSPQELHELSTYNKGSFAWWVKALQCKVFAHPILRTVGPADNVRVMRQLIAVDEFGLDIIEWGSNLNDAIDNNRSTASVQDYIVDYSDVQDKKDKFLDIKGEFIRPLKQFIDYFDVLEDETKLYEMFHEFIYLFNLIIDDSYYEKYEHMNDFKKPWIIENELQTLVDERMNADINKEYEGTDPPPDSDDSDDSDDFLDTESDTPVDELMECTGCGRIWDGNAQCPCAFDTTSDSDIDI